MINNTEKYILGVKISGSSTSSLLKQITKNIDSGTKFSITTVGPELLLMAQKNQKLKTVLNTATFSVPDGVGLKLAQPSLEIVKGRELFLDLIKLANKNSWKVFLLGGLDNEAEITAEKLKITPKGVQSNLKLKIQTAGGKDVNVELSGELIKLINNYEPHMLFVALGHPDQELFIQKYLPKLKVKGIMTVGGTFNYLAGKSKLPPNWIAGWGEWLWRLITEPKRIKRIFNATVLFPIEVLKENFFNILK